MKRDEEWGTIHIKVGEIFEERRKKDKSFSKNKLCHRANLERSQLNRYLNGDCTRLDIPVLSRICYALDCEISDILEYIPPDDKEKD